MHAIKKASLITISDERLQCAICSYLVVGPLQLTCGHRICTSCGRNQKQKSAVTFFCNKCKGIINFTDCFHDKALAKEIDNTLITCPQCAWTGEYRLFQGHLKDECQMAEVSCPHEGCMKVLIRSEIDDHVQKCPYKKQNVSSRTSPLNSPNHLAAKENLITQQCCFSFIGCQFVGNKLELSTHMEKDVHIHLSYVGNYLSTLSVNKIVNKHQALQSLLDNAKVDVEQLNNETNKTKLQVSELESQQKDMVTRLNGVEDLLATLQTSITEINRTYEEVSLTLQTLLCSNGKYIWKIPDITRCRRDAVMGKTDSLYMYSPPFYTDRFGYKLGLHVHLDGYGSGKGRYISYFITIMKGEYDALLEWPFQLTVTLTMINQKGNSNIVRSFRPNPNSASFHRPSQYTYYVNHPSGYPKFAALSVLDNPEFIVDDVAFFQCVISSYSDI